MNMKYNGVQFKLVSYSRCGLKITEHKEYKMEGIHSISSSCLENPFCMVNRKCPGSVCEYCYAEAQLNCYKKQREVLKKNTEILTKEIITEIPFFSSTIGRIEAFGDLQNITQAINYMNIVRFNPDVKFGWWTKNPYFIGKAIDAGWKKPKNLVILYSSPKLNKRESYSEIKRRFPFIDKIFTVYENEDKAKEEGVRINCQGKCITCENSCYCKTGSKYVNEIIKQAGFGSFKNKK